MTCVTTVTRGSCWFSYSFHKTAFFNCDAIWNSRWLEASHLTEQFYAFKLLLWLIFCASIFFKSVSINDSLIANSVWISSCLVKFSNFFNYLVSMSRQSRFYLPSVVLNYLFPMSRRSRFYLSCVVLPFHAGQNHGLDCIRSQYLVFLWWQSHL